MNSGDLFVSGGTIVTIARADIQSRCKAQTTIDARGADRRMLTLNEKQILEKAREYRYRVAALHSVPQ